MDIKHLISIMRERKASLKSAMAMQSNQGNHGEAFKLSIQIEEVDTTLWLLSADDEHPTSYDNVYKGGRLF